MKGVVQRGGEERGEPREVEIDGSAESFDRLLEEFPGTWVTPPAEVALAVTPDAAGDAPAEVTGAVTEQSAGS
jgi:hypothetical protein